jgi:hypothetical protein
MDPVTDLKYKIIALFLIFVSVIIIIVGIIFIHELPYKIACKRNNPQKDAIRCMALMGLVMFPLWLLAMIWAYLKLGAMSVTLQNNKDTLMIDQDAALEQSQPNIKKKTSNKILRFYTTGNSKAKRKQLHWKFNKSSLFSNCINRNKNEDSE